MASSFANLLTLALALVAGISSCRADTPDRMTIRIVNNYSLADQPNTWQGTSGSDIPNLLLDTTTIPMPSKAYAAPNTGVFLQNDRVIVCYETCQSEQPLHPDLKKIATSDLLGDGDKKVKITRLTSAYYWINRLFDKMAKLGYVPNRPLTVFVDRDVADPTSGVELTNNAFFNPHDWSVSFLPAHQSLYAKYKNLDVANSANDPSVVMHETVHSIFQTMIGSILNSEVYGLHEAFADYFSLAVLGYSEIGLIAGKGKAIRNASKTYLYYPRLEAHSLGNVVLCALWKIRNLYSDPQAADQVALETVRQVSLDPYSTAGDIVTAYSSALQKIAPKDLNNAGFAEAIQKIWEEAELKPTTVKPDLTIIQPPLKQNKSASATIINYMPRELADRFSWPERAEAIITQFEYRKNPSDQNLVWYRVGYSKENEANGDPMSFWILYDKVTGGILGAYDLAGNLIERDEIDFDRLLGIGGSLDDMISLTLDFSTEPREIYLSENELESPYSAILHVGSVNQTEAKTTLNGVVFKMNVLQRDVKPRLMTGIFEKLDPADRDAVLSQTTSVTLYTVGPAAISWPMSLVPLDDANKEYIIGYSIESATQASHSLILHTLN